MQESQRQGSGGDESNQPLPSSCPHKIEKNKAGDVSKFETTLSSWFAIYGLTKCLTHGVSPPILRENHPQIGEKVVPANQSSMRAHNDPQCMARPSAIRRSTKVTKINKHATSDKSQGSQKTPLQRPATKCPWKMPEMVIYSGFTHKDW